MEPAKPEENRENEPEAQQKTQHFGEAGPSNSASGTNSLAEALALLACLPLSDTEPAGDYWGIR